MLLRDHRRAAGEARPELADIFRQYGESYRKTHFLLAPQRKVMRAVSVCRTQELGGHLKQCDTCGFEHPSYNSCGNRHCPKCQSLAKAKWLQKQSSELLPVGYFHLVFTLPHELNRLILTHKKILLALLFKAVSETLLEFGQTHLKGTLGIIAVLHTWDQTLKDHFHLHCLVPAGALSFDHSRWINARKNFLFRVEPLSRVFRVGEGDLAVFEFEDAVVGERHPVRIATEVIEDFVWGGERLFRIEDPVCVAEPRSWGGEFALADGFPHPVKELTPGSKRQRSLEIDAP